MNGPPTLTEADRNGRRRSRLRLLIVACAAMLAAAATVALPGTAHAAVCSNQTGTNNGYYYQMWSNGQGSACINVGSGGNQYSTNWSGIGDFVAGVGWQPGSNQTVSFSGSMNASGGTALASLYGGSTNPLVEYYVIEDDQGGSPRWVPSWAPRPAMALHLQPLRAPAGQPGPALRATTAPSSSTWQSGREAPPAGRSPRRTSSTRGPATGMNLGSLNFQIFATEAWAAAVVAPTSPSASTARPPVAAVAVVAADRRLRWPARPRCRQARSAQLVQPQRRRHRLEHLDRDDEHGGTRGGLLDFGRQRHLAQRVRDESHAQRQR